MFKNKKLWTDFGKALMAFAALVAAVAITAMFTELNSDNDYYRRENANLREQVVELKQEVSAPDVVNFNITNTGTPYPAQDHPIGIGYNPYPTYPEPDIGAAIGQYVDMMYQGEMIYLPQEAFASDGYGFYYVDGFALGTYMPDRYNTVCVQLGNAGYVICGGDYPYWIGDYYSPVRSWVPLSQV